jgi:hypothetical protein
VLKAFSSVLDAVSIDFESIGALPNGLASMLDALSTVLARIGSFTGASGTMEGRRGSAFARTS